MKFKSLNNNSIITSAFLQREVPNNFDRVWRTMTFWQLFATLIVVNQLLVRQINN